MFSLRARLTPCSSVCSATCSLALLRCPPPPAYAEADRCSTKLVGSESQSDTLSHRTSSPDYRTQQLVSTTELTHPHATPAVASTSHHLACLCTAKSTAPTLQATASNPPTALSSHDLQSRAAAGWRCVLSSSSSSGSEPSPGSRRADLMACGSKKALMKGKTILARISRLSGASEVSESSSDGARSCTAKRVSHVEQGMYRDTYHHYWGAHLVEDE